MTKTKAKSTAKADVVNHPKHYGGDEDPFEVIKVIEGTMLPDEVIGAYKFEIARYMRRHRQKGGMSSILKAQFYMNRLVMYIESRGLQAAVES